MIRLLIITASFFLFLGCSNSLDFETTHKDLLCNTYTILNEYAYKDKAMLTTTISFDCEGNLFIKEKMWQLKEGVVHWVISPEGDTVTQDFKGSIVKSENGSQWEVITFNIRRLNMDGSEVIGGYKTQNIMKSTYNGLPVLRLADVGWQDLGGGGEWVEMRVGDTSYFYEED